ncbi:MAG: hypothetical protein HW421_2300 [Ignavibacteria bacterium]|nr:hypothetical protein [Ignavibacteria bacterium]
MFITSGRISYLILILFTYNLSLSQSENNFAKGWDYFIKNDFVNAKANFAEASENGIKPAESELMLSLIESIGFNPDKAFPHFLKYYESDTNPYPALKCLWTTPCLYNTRGKLEKEKLKFLKSLINSDKVNGTIKAYAYCQMGYHYERLNDFAEADDYFEKIGAIMNWQLAGEFENISGSGFDKEFEPMNHPEQSYHFKNRNGADVTWFDLPRLRPSRWVHLQNHFYTGNSIIFAQSFCNSPAEQIVYLRIGTSGSLKAWVNDKLAIIEEEERNNDLDTYTAKIKLAAGWNRILLQVGGSTIEYTNFLARITDSLGNATDDITYTNEYKPYSKNVNFNYEQIPDEEEQYFTEQIRKNPANLINYFLLA